MPQTSQRTVFLNGEYCDEAAAKVSIFDRGYLMADAVYEYTAVLNGKLIDFHGHMDRLQKSLDALDFDYSIDRDQVLEMHRHLVAENDVSVGGIYIQISRGVADRNFVFPKSIAPTIMAFSQEINFLDNPLNETGLKVITVEDGRWARRDIKSVQLLFTSMAKTQAVKSGANDAIFVKDGYVTEATAANAFIVKDKRIITRALSHDILHGVTRRAVLSLANKHGIEIEERAFSVEEMQNADEAFITASPLYALPIVKVDDVTIGSGRPGDMTKALRKIFLEDAQTNAL